jgi:Helix-turn-helix
MAPHPGTPSGTEGRNISYILNDFSASCSGLKALARSRIAFRAALRLSPNLLFKYRSAASGSTGLFLFTARTPCRALPIYHLEIRVLRPPYPRRWRGKQAIAIKLRTVEEHIKRKRLQQHLFQADLAKLFGVLLGSVRNWEQGIFQPAETSMPRIIEFLGYDPQLL